MKKNIKTLLVALGIMLTGLPISLHARENTNAACPTITVTLVKQVNATCHGSSNGMAIVSASGGVAPYTYAWSPSGGSKDTASSLAAGTYTVIATDNNGCTGKKVVTITQPAVLTVTISSVTEVACYGGSTGVIKPSVTGGTSPFTYSWSNGETTTNATALVAGSYTVTVNDKNGCGPVTTSATVTQPAVAITATLTSTEPSCNGGKNGTAIVTASGGTPGYTYSWNTGATTSSILVGAGTYKCTTTDKNGCKVINSLTESQPTVITITPTMTKPSCGSSNGSAVATVSGGTSPYTYTWSPSGGTNSTASGLSAGVYTVTVTDANSCTATSVYYLNNSNITTSITFTNVTCYNDANGKATVTTSGGVVPYHYSWSSGQTTSSITGLTPGNYSVTVTDKNGCSGYSDHTITQPSQFRDSIVALTNVLCYGASTGLASVGVKGGKSPYTYSWSPSGGTGAVASNLAAGTYTVVVNDNNGCGPLTTTVTVTQPAAALTAPITSSSSPLCNGNTNGDAVVTASGGTSPYTYSWSPSGGTKATASNLAGGTYTCTVKDHNSCTTTSTVVLTNPSAVTASITSSTNPSCSGSGSATVSASGGTGTLRYSWAPAGGTNATASSLAAGSYTCTVSDANNCTATATVTLTSPSSLTATISSSTNPTCSSSSNGNATVSGSGGVPPYSYAWSTGATTSTITALPDGTYTVTLTDAGSCIAVASVTLATTAVSVVITSSTNPLCAGGSTGTAVSSTVGGNPGYTYSWAPSGGTNATGGSLSAGTYTITATDTHGCTGTATVTLTDPAALSASVTSTNPLCNGTFDGSAIVTGTGGTGAYTYSWSPNSTTSDTATGLSAGSYTATVTDANGCAANATATLTNPPVLNANITSSTNPLCNSSANGSATVTASGGTPSYAYAWTPSGETTAAASGLAAGSYTVNVSDNNGCVSTATVALTDPAAIIASISSASNPKCNGSADGSASVTASGGTGTLTYNWTPSGGTNASASGLSAGSYTCTVTDGNGCSTTAMVTLTNPTAITASIVSSTNPLCNGNSNGTANVTASGGTGTLTYNWAPSGGTGTTATGLAAGSYTCIVTDVNGCTATATVALTDPAALVASISSSTNPLCNGSSNGSITVSASGGTGSDTYAWTPSGGTNTTANGLVAGSYTCTVTDGNGCTATASKTLTDPASVTGTIVSTDPKCNGSSDGSATVTSSGGNGVYTYSWLPSGGTNATANGLVAGSYTVTITDGNSCTGTATVSLTNPTSVVVNITSSSNPLCNGSSTGSATAIASGGTGTYTYAWASSGGTNATANNLTAGTYTITATDANGCTATNTVTLTDPVLLTASVTASTNPLCNGSSTGSATVTASGGTGTDTYNWTPSGGTNASATNLAAGSYTCIVTDANGCSTTATVTLTDPAALTATITSSTDPTCSTGGSATVLASGGTGAYTYSWSPAGGTNTTASGLLAGTYTATVTDANGCTATATVALTNASAPTITFSVTNVLCNGNANGSVVANVTGGTPAYTYSWSPASSTTDSITGLTAGSYTLTVTDSKGCSAIGSATVNQPAVITYTLSTTDASCTCNGTASITVSGGTAPYTYIWTAAGSGSTVSNLCAGGYSVTVTDANNCLANTGFVVGSAPTLRDSIISATEVSCNGGNNGCATQDAIGGTPPYTYSWAPSGNTSSVACGLTAGTYTASVTDASGCTATATVTITQPSAIAVSLISITNASCGKSNGSATVSATGGTPGYIYSWTPSGETNATASGLIAGTYTVTATDVNGCIGNDIVFVNDSTSLMAKIDSIKNATCNGMCNGAVYAGASGGNPPYSYTWTPSVTTTASATSLCAGKYNFTVTDSIGCVVSDTATITQPTPLVVTIDTLPEAGCNAKLWVVVSGGTAPYTYQWNTGVTTDTLNGNCNQEYNVTVTDANGCTAKDSSMVIPTGINGLSVTSGIDIYPVPTTGNLNVSISEQGLQNGVIMIYDIAGREVMEQKVTGNTSLVHMDVSKLSNGTYLLKLTDGNILKVARFTVTR